MTACGALVVTTETPGTRAISAAALALGRSTSGSASMRRAACIKPPLLLSADKTAAAKADGCTSAGAGRRADARVTDRARTAEAGPMLLADGGYPNAASRLPSWTSVQHALGQVRPHGHCLRTSWEAAMSVELAAPPRPRTSLGDKSGLTEGVGRGRFAVKALLPDAAAAGRDTGSAEGSAVDIFATPGRKGDRTVGSLLCLQCNDQ